MSPTVLMSCTHHWTSPLQVGSHHLARRFVQHGYEVAYISAPLTPLHFLRGPGADTAERFALYRSGGRRFLGRKLWAYVPFALIAPANRPLLRSGQVVRHWSKTAVPGLPGTAARNGFADVDVLYMDSIFQPFWLRDLGYKKSVFRIMDNHSGFPGAGDTSRSVVKQIGSGADLIAYSAAGLASYAAGLGCAKTVHVPNGIDFGMFASASRQMPAELRGISGPIAVYAGAFDRWFDDRLLRQAARRLPHISFVLIGPGSSSDQRFSGLPNVRLLGPVKHAELPRYLYNCTVGIIPFNVDAYPDLINSVNPLKLYEYMACGLPVVATHWDELETIGSPAALCRGAEQFIQALDEAVNRPPAPEDCIGFARGHDWETGFKTLLSALESV